MRIIKRNFYLASKREGSIFIRTSKTEYKDLENDVRSFSRICSESN